MKHPTTTTKTTIYLRPIGDGLYVASMDGVSIRHYPNVRIRRAMGYSLPWVATWKGFLSTFKAEARTLRDLAREMHVDAIVVVGKR